MLLYKTTYQMNNPEERTQTITVVSFQGSQTEASKARTEAKGVAIGKKPETQTIEVPTNKAGLLEWLNANVTS